MSVSSTSSHPHVVEVDGAHNAWLVRPRQFNDAVDEAIGYVAGGARTDATRATASTRNQHHGGDERRT